MRDHEKKQIIVQALRAQLTTNKNKGAKINFANMSFWPTGGQGEMRNAEPF